jgi:hypothetical protein
MIGIAIQILWLLFGAICCAGVVWLFIYGVKRFIYDIQPNLEAGIWFLFLLLLIIAALTMFASGSIHVPSFR